MNGYGRKSSMVGHPAQNYKGPGRGINKKAVIIISSIAGAILAAVLIILLVRSGGASSAEAAARKFAEACGNSNASALIDAMLPSNCQKYISNYEREEMNMQMSMIDADIEVQSVELKKTYTPTQIADLKEEIIDELHCSYDDLDIAEACRYHLYLTSNGEYYRPRGGEFTDGYVDGYPGDYSGSFRGAMPGNTYSFEMTVVCYRVGGSWYCFRY